MALNPEATLSEVWIKTSWLSPLKFYSKQARTDFQFKAEGWCGNEREK